MKLAACILLLQMLLLYNLVFSRKVSSMAPFASYDRRIPLEIIYKNILVIVEHMMVDQGTQNFDCVFYDITSENPFDVVLGDLLRSPRLQYVVKYVIKGFRKTDRRYPRKPSLLLIHHTGTGKELDPKEADFCFYQLMLYFNPATAVIVIMDFRTDGALNFFHWVAGLRFMRVVYMNTVTGLIMLASGFTCTDDNFVLKNPGAIEKWHQRALRNRDIIYALGEIPKETSIDLQWIEATAKYMNVGLAEYNPKKMKTYDIDLAERLIMKYTGGFHRIIFQTALGICKIIVPKEKPLSIVEIMTMPFNWTVWTLLFIILAATEVASHLRPGLFSNDPILYVVFGFERRVLHQAAIREKIILISLVILMFFMTNAFETKVISLMTKRPSPQHIKSLADFDKYGLKFRYNLSHNPGMVNHPIIGKYVVHSNESTNFLKPNGAYHFKRSHARIMKRFPTLVVLDEEYFEGVVGYKLENRSTYGEILQYTYNALGEAGLWDLWRFQWEDRTFGKQILYEKDILTFDDFLPAWFVLGIGWCVGFAGFLGELLKMLLKIHRQMIRSRAVKIWNCFWRSIKKLSVTKLKK